MTPTDRLLASLLRGSPVRRGRALDEAVARGTVEWSSGRPKLTARGRDLAMKFNPGVAEAQISLSGDGFDAPSASRALKSFLSASDAGAVVSLAARADIRGLGPNDLTGGGVSAEGAARLLGALRAVELLRAPIPAALLTGSDAALWVRDRIDLGAEVESIWVAGLDASGRPRGIWEVARGSDAGASVAPRDILAPLMRVRAHQVVLAHNHPSGVLDPSDQDRTFTRRVVEICRFLEIRFLAHLIFAPDGRYLEIL